MLAFALLALRRAPVKEFVWARASLGLYAGWLTAASAVGTSVLLSGYGVLAQQTAAVLMLVVGLALAVGTVLTTAGSNPTYGLAFQWALVGVFIQSVNTKNLTMGLLVAVGAVVVAVALWKGRTAPG